LRWIWRAEVISVTRSVTCRHAARRSCSDTSASRANVCEITASISAALRVRAGSSINAWATHSQIAMTQRLSARKVCSVLGPLLPLTPTFLLGREVEARQNGCNSPVNFVPRHRATGAQYRHKSKNQIDVRPEQVLLCVPKIRFGVDGASGRRKLAS
jgi:hypothetical protein